METLQNELFNLPEWSQFVRVTVRLTAAVLLGGALGFERQRGGKAAGLRTHMLVALGTALFAVVPMEAGMPLGDFSRVIQGIAAGVGFLGAGTILKRQDSEQIKGLTTAAGLWLTAAVGMAVGSGWIWVPVVAVVLALLILRVFTTVEDWMDNGNGSNG
jgi:putative Mg2+ transporter-C (MgtC) family protein